MKNRTYIFTFITLSFSLYFSIQLIIIENLSYIFNEELPMWEEVKVNSKKNFNTNIDVIIGDSRAKAGLIPNRLGINWYNFSIGGATPIEGYYTLEHLINSGNRIDNIILSYGPLHLINQYTFWHRNAKFHFLTPYQHIKIDSLASNLKDPIFGTDKNWYDYWLKPGVYFGDIKDSLVKLNENHKKNIKVSRILHLSKGHYFFGKNESSSGYNQEANMDGIFKASPVLNDYLDKTINLAKSENIDIFWVTAPYNQSSMNKIEDEFNTGFDNYIRGKTDLIPLTLSHSLPDHCFGDPSHIYRCSDSFSESISKKINSIISKKNGIKSM